MIKKIFIKDGINVPELTKFSQIDIEEYREKANAIIEDVIGFGDEAIKKYTLKFDGVKIETLRVCDEEFRLAYEKVTKKQINSIKLMKRRLEYNEIELIKRLRNIKTSFKGITIKKTIKPISEVGCYIPGGEARYPSTLVMCAVPARMAGVKRLVVATPPLKNGKIDPLTLVAANICKVDEVYKMGGAQAIAALAFGTESIKKVDKIVGPGGMIVNAAKSLVSNKVSVDMIAGPTELLIYADSKADPKIVAKDLISQSEHSSDTFCSIVTISKALANKVQIEISKMLNDDSLPRIDIIRKSVDNNSFIAICRSEKIAISIINELAPEHLEILSNNSKDISSQITSAGVILIGKYSPSSGSDYCFGTNHVLPTMKFGKSRSCLSVLDFVKLVNIITATKKGLREVENSIKEISHSEGLFSHYYAVKARFE